MLVDLLARCETFADLEPDRLRALAARCTEVAVPAGQLVFVHGDTADSVYLVVEGSLTLTRDQVGRPMQLLGRIGAGELLGELCLFDEDKRAGSARASTACRLLRIDRGALLELLRLEPGVALRIQNTAARRHNSNSVAALELGQQSEVRIRLHANVRLRFASGREVPAVLANLSVGGMSLEDAPMEWSPEATVRFDLVAEGEALHIDGRVAWRRADSVGIAFLSQAPGHERLVHRLLRRLAE
jgi:CRP-like cAMP-binding protein